MKRICYTSMRRAVLLGAVAAVMIAAAVGVFVWMLGVEPAFYDEACVAGIPEALPQEYGYTFYQAQDVCDVWLCGNPAFDGKNLDLYLTNPKENEGISIRVEVYSIRRSVDENGKVTGVNPDKLFGKSGFIRTGEYVKRVTLDRALKEQTPVILKISTYAEDTGKSHGFFYVTTVVTPR